MERKEQTMSQTLSAVKFIRNNKRQIFVVISALSLAFMAMYVMQFILMVTEQSFRPVMLEQPKKITFAYLSGESLGLTWDDDMTEESYQEQYQKKMDDLMEELRAQDGIKECYYTQLLGVSYVPVVGNWWYTFPMLEAEQIPDYLKYMDAKLVEGRLPERDGEVLLDQKVMMNHDYRIGDYFLEGNYGKIFTIVGTLQSDSMVCAGTPNGYTNVGWALTVLHEESRADFREVMRSLGKTVAEEDTIDDAVRNKKDYESDVAETIESAISVILVVVVAFLAIAVFVTYISFMRNRVGEWCLYMSIGYSRKEIYGLIMREILILFGTSMAVGCVLSALMMVILAKILIIPKGLSFGFWYPAHFLRLCAIYVFLIGMLQIPVCIIIQKIQTIDQVED